MCIIACVCMCVYIYTFMCTKMCDVTVHDLHIHYIILCKLLNMFILLSILTRTRIAEKWKYDQVVIYYMRVNKRSPNPCGKETQRKKERCLCICTTYVLRTLQYDTSFPFFCLVAGIYHV